MEITNGGKSILCRNVWTASDMNRHEDLSKRAGSDGHFSMLKRFEAVLVQMSSDFHKIWCFIGMQQGSKIWGGTQYWVGIMCPRPPCLLHACFMIWSPKVIAIMAIDLPVYFTFLKHLLFSSWKNHSWSLSVPNSINFWNYICFFKSEPIWDTFRWFLSWKIVQKSNFGTFILKINWF